MSKTIPTTRLVSPVVSGKRAKPGGGRATGRVSKQQWLDAALEMLVSDGVDAVRITDLASVLNISKSGFYWHFENRNELLTAMMNYWVNEFSEEIIDEFNQQVIFLVPNQNNLLTEKLLLLIQMIRKKQAGKYDLAFASWAQRVPLVQELVDQVRDMRIRFIIELLADSGYTGDHLESRARLFVMYFSWPEVVFKQTDDRSEGELLEEIVKIITGPAIY